MCGSVNIDSLVLNEYEYTMIDFFKIDDINPYKDKFSTVINGWFRAFSTFTQIILIILLVATGIMAMLKAGSADNKKVFNSISGWVIAVALLFFGPYGMKYVVQINDAIVEELRNQSKYSMFSVFNIDFKKDFAEEIEKYNQACISGENGLTSGDKLEWQVGEDSFTYAIKKFMKWVSTYLADSIEDTKEEMKKVEEKINFLNTNGMRAQPVVVPNPGGPNSNIMLKAMNPGFINIFYTIKDKSGNITNYSNVLGKVKTQIRTNKLSAANALAEEVSEISLTDKGEELNFKEVTDAYSRTHSRYITWDMYREYLRNDPTRLNMYTYQLNWVNMSRKVRKEGLKSLLKEYAELEEKLVNLERKQKIIEEARGNTRKLDLMGMMKERAGETNRIFYVIVWFILIYQLVMLVFLYFKRLIYTSVLIAVYPLVIAFYGLERAAGIDKPKALSTWIKEFIVNIFIQSVHALLYLILVETGLAIFDADPDNWLIFLIAVTSLFPMEALLKSLLGLKSSTVKDLKSSAGALAAAAGIIAVAKAGGGKGASETHMAKAQAKNKKTDERNARSKNRMNAFTNYVNRKLMQRGQATGKMEKFKAAGEKLRDFAKKWAENKDKRLKRRKKRRLKLAKGYQRLQRLRNLHAKFSAITTALAMGGDADDFIAGATIASMAAGSTRVKKKTEKNASKQTGNSNGTQGSAPSQRAAGGNRYGNVDPASYGGNAGQPQANGNQNTNGAPNANTNQNSGGAPATNNGPAIPTPLQNEFRDRLTQTSIDVNSSDPTYRTVPHETDSNS